MLPSLEDLPHSPGHPTFPECCKGRPLRYGGLCCLAARTLVFSDKSRHCLPIPLLSLDCHLCLTWLLSVCPSVSSLQQNVSPTKEDWTLFPGESRYLEQHCRGESSWARLVRDSPPARVASAPHSQQLARAHPTPTPAHLLQACAVSE